jgi:hypothetical protein
MGSHDKQRFNIAVAMGVYRTYGPNEGRPRALNTSPVFVERDIVQKGNPSRRMPGLFCKHQLLPLTQLLKDASDDRTLKGDRVRPLYSLRIILAKLCSDCEVDQKLKTVAPDCRSSRRIP